jgi:hypothetical protein
MEDAENFTLNYLDVEQMKLPYWLMNSEELESIFIESNENNSHNQVSQFRKAVIKNKEKHNSSLSKVTYDTPVYFSMQEVYNYIYNLNNEVINKKENEQWLPKVLLDNNEHSLIDNKNLYFDKIYKFVSSTTSKAEKASNGAFNGEFDRLINLAKKSSSSRYNFKKN